MAPAQTAPEKSKKGKQIRDFIALGRTIFQDKELADFDQLIDEKKDLEGKLAAKTKQYDAKVKELAALQLSKDEAVAAVSGSKLKELTALRAASDGKVALANAIKDGFMQTFEKKFKAWDMAMSRKSDLQGQVDDLTNDLTEANLRAEEADRELSAARDLLLESQNAFNEKKKELKSCQTKLNTRQWELQSTADQLESVQSMMEDQRLEIGFHNPSLEDLTHNFRALTTGCHQVAKTYFCAQLPPNRSPVDLSQALKISGFFQNGSRRLPISNTISSQYLRMATAERIIADKLSSRIFCPYYLPNAGLSRGLLDDIVDRLDKISFHKVALFRRQLIAAYDTDEQTHVANLIGIVVDEIIEVLLPLLPTSTTKDEFRSVLVKLFGEAVKLWQSIQRSSLRAIVTSDPYIRNDSDEDLWVSNEEYDNAVELSPEDMEGTPEQEPIFALFPQISVGNKVISAGCALWTDQNVVIAGQAECMLAASHAGLQGRCVRRRDSDKKRHSFSASKKADNSIKPPMSPSASSHSQPQERAEDRSSCSRKPLHSLRRMATPPLYSIITIDC